MQVMFWWTRSCCEGSVTSREKYMPDTGLKSTSSHTGNSVFVTPLPAGYVRPDCVFGDHSGCMPSHWETTLHGNAVRLSLAEPISLANERRRYILTSSLIDWAHTQKWSLQLEPVNLMCAFYNVRMVDFLVCVQNLWNKTIFCRTLLYFVGKCIVCVDRMDLWQKILIFRTHWTWIMWHRTVFCKIQFLCNLVFGT